MYVPRDPSPDVHDDLTLDPAETLLSFSETQDTRVKAIMENKETIGDDSLTLADIKLKKAIATVWSACTGLIADAEAAEQEAKTLLGQLRAVCATSPPLSLFSPTL